MRWLTVPVALLLSIPCAADAPPAAQADQRIPVFVKSGSATGGFTDPDKGRLDSTKDIMEKLRDSKTVRVAAEDQAVIILEILGRDTKLDQGHALTAMFGGLGQKHSSVTVRLTAGEYTTEFTGTGGASGVFSGYGKAAAKVMKELDAWVKANDAKLREIAAQKAQGLLQAKASVVPALEPAAPGPVATAAAVPMVSPSSQVEPGAVTAPTPTVSPSPQ